MKNFKEFLEESKANNVLSDKLKNMNSLKKFSYPTPEERRAQLAKEKEKKDVKESEDLDESDGVKSGGVGGYAKATTSKGIKRDTTDSSKFDKRTDELVLSGDHESLLKHLSTHVNGKSRKRDAYIAKLKNSITSKMKKESLEYLDERTNQEHEFIMQSLADKDINSHIKDGKVVVHKDNVAKAKSQLKKMGHEMQVVHEGFEELEEAMVGHTTKSLSKYVKSLGWTLVRTDGGHDVYKHPKSVKNLPIPRHAGELSRPTVAKMLKRAEFREGEEMLSFKEFITEDQECQIDESYKKKYETAPDRVKRVADEMARLRKMSKSDLIRTFPSRLNTNHLKSEPKDIIIGGHLETKFSHKDLRAHDKHFFGESTEVVEDQEDLMEDLHDRLSTHIRNMRNDGHHVVITDRGSDGRSAKFVSTKGGIKRLHTITMNSIKQERIGGKDKEEESQETEKRGRGRPAGSKSGARA
jgi:predicted RNA binding protein YcfA (HicA-like mRNA interferase family)